MIKLTKTIREVKQLALQKRIKFKERTKRYYDKKVTDPKFKPGEFVFLLKEP